MKKIIVGTVAGFSFFFFSFGAQAQILEFFAEVPLRYNFAETESTDSVSGAVFGVRSFFAPVGIGVEKYTIDTKSGKSIDVEFVDLFYSSVFPFFDLVLGIGVGSASYDAITSANFDDADLLQWYVGAGYPIAPFLGIFIGYHSVSGNGKAKTAGQPSLKVDGNMVSLGIRFGF